MTDKRHRGRPRKKEENFDLISVPKDMVDFLDKLREWEKFRERYYVTSRAEFVRRALSHYFKMIKDEIGTFEEEE